MAGLPKGNSIALQALKPLPTLNVADLATNFINTYDKAQAAKEQARLKALQDEKEAIGKYFDKIEVKPFSTIPNITDQSNQLYQKSVDLIGRLGIMADQDPENKLQYQAKAKKIQANFAALGSTFGSKEFVEAAQKKLESYNSGDFYMDSDEKERLEMISASMLQMDLDETTGEFKFALPRNKNAKPNDPVQWYSAGEVQGWYTNPEKLDWMNTTNANKGNTFLKELTDISKVFADEWSKNTDGNRTKEWKGFAKERAEAWFDNVYGEYNANLKNEKLNQFAKQKLGHEIGSEEDYKAVKKAVVETIGSQVPTKNVTDTRNTALDDALKRAQIEKLKKDEQTASQGDGFVYGNTAVRINTKPGKAMMFDTPGISMPFNYRNEDGQYQAGQITAYYNPNGTNAFGKKGNVAYGVSLPNKDGTGYTTVPLGGKGKLDKTGYTTAMRYVGKTGQKKLNEAAKKILSDPNFQRSGRRMGSQEGNKYFGIDFKTVLKNGSPAYYDNENSQD